MRRWVSIRVRSRTTRGQPHYTRSPASVQIARSYFVSNLASPPLALNERRGAAARALAARRPLYVSVVSARLSSWYLQMPV